MSNMKLCISSATCTFTTNPVFYDHSTVELKDDNRADDGHLINHHRADYDVFELQFDYMGTAQMMELKTIWEAHENIYFYPFDEVRGTALNYQVRWMNEFRPRFISNFWNSGFSMIIQFEEI